MANFYIGLMSGTSADGIDVALVNFHQEQPELVASHYQAYSTTTQAEITSLYTASSNEIERANRLDKALAHLFADAIHALLTKAQLSASDIIAIGNHGQTVRHRPALAGINEVGANEENAVEADATKQFPFTLQIGCSQTLACLTGIPVIGQFRLKDMALGGQGAPLVPPFHQFLLSKLHPESQQCDQIVVNMGGIANITYLPASTLPAITLPATAATKNHQVLGFDTGPGNCLMDDWYQAHHTDSRFDKNGQWAASGQCDPKLLDHLLSDPYFTQAYPKSTGREIFHHDWLVTRLAGWQLPPEDVQATLLALTTTTIVNDIRQLTSDSSSATIWLCGGGRLNQALVKQLADKLSPYPVAAIDSLAIDGDQLEAMAFAWLAYAYQHGLASNMPAVTGASRAATLGALFTP